MPLDQLVSSQWLADEMGASDLRILDATWFLPDSGRDARAEYEKAHIPGAIFMDLGELTDSNNPVPNMMPPPEKFASRMQSLGIGDGSRIVVYANSPLRSAPRAWWLFNIFGAHDVALLDGGMGKWMAEGKPTETGKPERRHRHFTVWQDGSTIRDKADMLTNIKNNTAQVIDARPAERFEGTTPEPRADIEAGHIPNSRNLPYSKLYNEDGTWKRDNELRAVYHDAGIDLDKPIITTCGSGVTAASLLFGLHLLGKKDVALYDGSWSEWGADPDLPKATGKA